MWRWIRRGLLGLAGVVVVLVALLAWALGHLGTPWVQDLTRATIAEMTGLELRWQAGSVSTDRFTLLGLEVASAAVDRDLAPQTLRIAEIQVPLDLAALRAGQIRATGVVIRGVDLHVVVDADGGLSLQRLLPVQPSPTPTRAPTSWLSLLGAVPSGSRAQIDVRDITITVHQRRMTGGEARLLSVTKLGAILALDGAATPATLQVTVRGPGQITASAGDAAQGPLGLPPLRHLSLPENLDDGWRHRLTALTGAWSLKLRGEVHVTVEDGRHLHVVADVLAPDGLPLPGAPTRVVQLDAALRLARPARLRAELRKLRVFDEALLIHASAELPDGDAAPGGDYTEVSVDAQSELAPWLAWLPANVARASADTLQAAAALSTPRLLPSEPEKSTWQVRTELRMARLYGGSVASGGAGSARQTDVAIDVGRLQVSGTAAQDRVALRLAGGLEGVVARAADAIVRWRSVTLGESQAQVVRAARTDWGWRIDDSQLAATVDTARFDSGIGSAGARSGRVHGAASLRASGDARALHAALTITGDADVHAPAAGMAAGLTVTNARLSLKADVAQPAATPLKPTQGGSPPAAGGAQLAPTLVRASGQLELGQVRGSHGGRRVHASAVRWTVASEAVARIAQGLRIGSLTSGLTVGRFAGAGVRVSEPVKAEVQLTAITADTTNPDQSHGKITFSATALGNSIALKLQRMASPLTWQATVAAPRLGDLVALVPMSAAIRKQVGWRTLKVDATSRGQLDNPGQPLSSALHHDTEIELRGLSLRLPSLRVAVPVARFTARGRSRGARFKQDLGLVLTSPRIGKWRGSGRLRTRGTIDVDPGKPALHVSGESRIPGGPTWALKLDATHAAGKAVVAWEATSTKLKGLGRAVPQSLQDAVCLDAERLSGSWRGTLTTSLRRSDLLRPAAWQKTLLPLDHAKLKVAQTLIVRGMRCRQPTMALTSPEAQFEATVALRGGVATMASHIRVRRLRGHVRDRRIDLRGLDQGVNMSGPLPLKRGVIRVELDGVIKRLDQDLIPAWPISNARLTGVILARNQQFMRLHEVTLHNPSGGTTLRISGGMDSGRALKSPTTAAPPMAGGAVAEAHPLPGRRGFTFTGELTQDMAQLGAATELVRGKGRVVMPYRLESGDLHVFRVTANLKFEDVDLAVPKWAFSVRGVRGNLPVMEVIDVRDGQVRLLGGGTRNPLARWRFQDQQPFLSGDPFIGIQALQLGTIRFGPIAGNALLDRNVFRLDQLEARAMRGQVTGQCIIDWQGRDTVMLFRGNGTGLRLPGSDDRMDLNAALRFEAGQLALSGQAQLLRTTRAHLRAMMDLWDPYHADARANKMRMLLKVGYPDRVRVVFRHGFADFLIVLGGVAELVSVEEIRGIPLGPMMQRWVAPLLPPKGAE